MSSRDKTTPVWLSGMDSNHDKELQRLLCYHYTTGQTATKLAFRQATRKEKVALGRDALRCPRGVQPRNHWFPSLISSHSFGPLNAARDGAARHPYR